MTIKSKLVCPTKDPIQANLFFQPINDEYYGLIGSLSITPTGSHVSYEVPPSINQLASKEVPANLVPRLYTYLSFDSHLNLFGMSPIVHLHSAL